MRQPLQDTVPNTGSTMRLRSIGVDGLSKPKSVSGLENRKKSSRVKVLLGGIFQRSSSRSLESAVSSPHDGPHNNIEEKQQQQQQYHLTPKTSEDSVEQDATQSTEPVDADLLNPVADENLDFNVRLVEEEDDKEHEQENKEIWEEKKRVGATQLQALFRGYRQRYEFKMLLLRLQLDNIQSNKERQLKKIEERKNTQKKHERSSYQFLHDKTGRQLQRVSRVVPYLFREAQAKVQANVQLVASSQELQELKASDKRLKAIASEYLDLLETIPGIWQALKVEWMETKKPRPRRSFGPDGKIIRFERESITQDDDLPPVEDERDETRVRPVTPTEQSTFVNLFIQAHAHEIYATEESIDEAVEQIQELVEAAIWN